MESRSIIHFLKQNIGTHLVYYPSTFSLLSLLFFFTFILFKWFSFSHATNKNPPPSLPNLPIIGNLHQLSTYPHRTLQTLSHRYGPIMSLKFGTVPVVVVSSADIAREIMKTHDAIFSERPGSSIIKRLQYDLKGLVMAPYGEYWKQMRSIAVLHLLSNKKVQSFRSVREEETAILIEKINGSLNSSVDLSEMFETLTNDVVSRVALGRKYSASEFRKLFLEYMELVGTFYISEFIPGLGWLNWVSGLDAKIKRVFTKFDDFLEGVVDEHIQANASGNVYDRKQDMVDVLLEIQKSESTRLPIGKANIKAVIVDMFIGGTDTTYTVMEWAMTELLLHPEVMKILQHEVHVAIGSKPNITKDDIDKMHYLKAVIKETLRLHPPVPLLFRHTPTQDGKIKGYDIPVGNFVIINAWAIGRDPVTWDKPEEFRPERFFDSSVDYRGQDFQLIPFGAGRRGCPGIEFAMGLNELVLACLVHKFEWSLPRGMRREDLDMTECSGLTIHRKVPLLAIATKCAG